jgi:hypothetical protein
MFTMTRSVPVNDRGDPNIPVLNRDQVWKGLELKAENALPFVPKMTKCDTIERALHCRPTDGCQLCASNRGEDDWRATTEGAILQGIGGAGGSAANNLQDIAFAVA